MVRPWGLPPLRSDYQAAAGILVNLSQGRSTVPLLRAVSAGQVEEIPSGLLVPPAVVQVTDDYLLVAVSGTNNWLQWVCHFLGSNQVTEAPFPGQVNDYFAQAANSLRAALVDYEPLIEGRRLILIGHSFGAAIVQLLASVWQTLDPRIVVTICFGSPRVGDANFGDAVISPPYLVQTEGDPVPSFPPENWFGKGTPWTGFFGLQPAVYTRSGLVVSLGPVGTLGTNDNTMEFSRAVDVVSRGQFTAHSIEEYLRRLSAVTVPPLDGWDDPDQVEEILDWEALTFSPVRLNQGGPNVAITMGIMYFRSSEETAGWGESWCGAADISAMLLSLKALAPIRALSLSSSCEIHAVKASDIDPARVANKSRSEILDSPIPGKGSGTSIKDQGSTLTNETMDAIDYELQSAATASRRIFPFRGIPDDWVAGSKRSGNGIGADKKFMSYFDAVKKANLGFKRYDQTKPKVVIQSITSDPATLLLKITSPAHGLLDRQLVQIRRFAPNPMLNGTWRVAVVDVNNFFLAGSNRFNAQANGVGTWQLKNIVTDGIDSVFFNSVSTRKVGRPFGARRGKRSARILHH